MIRALIILAAVLASGTAGAETLFTQSGSGTISLNYNLTAEQCEKARIASLPYCDRPNSNCGSWMTTGSEIIRSECLK